MTIDLKPDETGSSTSPNDDVLSIAPNPSPDDNKMMASFRVDRELWAKFGAIAKRERLTATDVLTDYIQRCTSNDKTQYSVNTSNDLVSTSSTETLTRNDVVSIVNDVVLTHQEIRDIAEATIKDSISSLKAPGTDDDEPTALAELEALMHKEIAAVRLELKKHLAIVR
jgi:hypothetical protein